MATVRYYFSRLLSFHMPEIPCLVAMVIQSRVWIGTVTKLRPLSLASLCASNEFQRLPLCWPNESGEAYITRITENAYRPVSQNARNVGNSSKFRMMSDRDGFGLPYFSGKWKTICTFHQSDILFFISQLYCDSIDRLSSVTCLTFSWFCNMCRICALILLYISYENKKRFSINQKNLF